MNDLRPFTIEVPAADTADLKARIRSTRWPSPATTADWSQGVPVEYLRQLAEYWVNEWDWSATEARLNRRPQVRFEVDQVGIHAFHARSPHTNATPLILTHGWPGSFLEFERVVDRLTDPERHGGSPEDAFHVVLPSLPGYGFSGKPAQPGWGVHRIADAWAELMAALGYDHFAAGGSDWGTTVSTSLGMRHPDAVDFLFLVPPLAPSWSVSEPTIAEGQAARDLYLRSRDGSAYSEIHKTRPQTIGYSLADSPVGLCAWILEKVWSWTDHVPTASLPISWDDLLDNVSLYWLTNSGPSSIRLYNESIEEVSRWITEDAGQVVTVPTAGVVFPAEVPRVSRREAQQRFSRIVYWGEPQNGGHFGAWERPEEFTLHCRAAAGAWREHAQAG